MMLALLVQSLGGQDIDTQVRQQAAEQGFQRWQKGYELHELLEELHQLNRLLLDELGTYWKLHPTSDWKLGTKSYERVAWFIQESITGCVEQYYHLMQQAASNRVETLQQTLNRLNELTRQRGDLLREASHDLRSTFGVIQGSASFLGFIEDASPEDRKQMVEMLNRNLVSAQEMVMQLMDLAFLEVGQDSVKTSAFDVSSLLEEQLASFQNLAQEQGLLLTAEGPPELIVNNDPVKVQRVVQNLVLKLLKHPSSAWVSVSWRREDNDRWLLAIQVSKSSLPESDASPTSLGLTPEGADLAIVERLCELLKANLTIESLSPISTLFRIRFPLQWNS
jgi:signal transduction histidine kinase